MFAAAMVPLSLASNASLGVEYDNDCSTSCSAERDSRVAACPSPYDSTGDREQCLKDILVAYNACIKSCPPPSQPQSTPSPVSKEAKLSAP